MTFESFIVESGARHRLWILPEAWKTRRRVSHTSLDGPSAVHRLHRLNYWSLSQEWSKTGYDQQPRVGQKLNVALGQFPNGASIEAQLGCGYPLHHISAW
jgi:hypothetical protein